MVRRRPPTWPPGPAFDHGKRRENFLVNALRLYNNACYKVWMLAR